MSPRATSLFACQSCGASSPKWLGRCPECGEWNSYVEEAPAPAPSAGAASARPLSGIETRSDDRVSTGLPGLDRVLGGGLVAGSVVLLGGEPGVGKSTLLLQAAAGVARGATVLYATGEESSSQVRLRATRLGLAAGPVGDAIRVVPETGVGRIVELARAD